MVQIKLVYFVSFEVLIAGSSHSLICVIELKMLVHPALAEPNTKHQELQWRVIGYFIDVWYHLGEPEADTLKLELSNSMQFKDYTGPIQKNLCTPMFIAAQFTIAKHWKQPKCPSANEWIQKLWYIYTMEFYTAERKKALITFSTA